MNRATTGARGDRVGVAGQHAGGPMCDKCVQTINFRPQHGDLVGAGVARFQSNDLELNASYIEPRNTQRGPGPQPKTEEASFLKDF